MTLVEPIFVAVVGVGVVLVGLAVDVGAVVAVGGVIAAGGVLQVGRTMRRIDRAHDAWAGARRPPP